MSCELVCVCVSLVRVVIICPASTHTALVSSPSLTVVHLSTYIHHVDSSQSHVNSSLSHSQRLSGVSIDPSLRLTSVSPSCRLSGVSIDPSLRLTSVSLQSLPAFSSVSSATGSRECPRAPESARECPRVPRLPESTRATSFVMWSGQWAGARDWSRVPYFRAVVRGANLNDRPEAF